MGAVSYTNNGNTYDIKPINDLDNVGTDMEAVLDIIEGTDLDMYRAKMLQAVEQGYAYELYVNDVRSGFFYNTTDEDRRYYGNSVKVDSDIIGVFFMLKQMFDIYDAHKIIFMPHKDNLKYFKSMVRGDKIRAYNANGSPISVSREVYTKYADKLAKYFWGV